MGTETGRKLGKIARMEMFAIGFGGGGSPAPVIQYVEPEPPPPVEPAPAAPEKSQAEIELEQDVANKDAISASKRQGRKSTILTQGISAGKSPTSGGGLLTYESMTGLKKDKLGG